MQLTETRTGVKDASLDIGPWSCCSSTPGAVSHPDQFDFLAAEWLDAQVPGTVSQALADAGRWDWHHPPALDNLDWWYRTTFHASEQDIRNSACWLNFQGLATLAEVWLNGEQLLLTDNMFREYRLEITEYVKPENELVIGFRSLLGDLSKKRPRPRWKTKLVNQQQLRWRRTTLFGRIPGWSPPIPPIGPWRDIRIERSHLSLQDVQLATGLEGTTGVVSVTGRLKTTLFVDRVVLKVGHHECVMDVRQTHDEATISAELRIPEVLLWWPHSHGAQPLYHCEITVVHDSGCHLFDIGRIGFRQLNVDRSHGFSLELNGQPIYCRGACWTISDAFRLDGSEESLRRDLMLAREAGANMLRVTGTMVYESDQFYRLCDELGIMVWQDFMFANMDYPVDDPTFAENIEAEAVCQLRRLSPHPCVVVYCGNSEVEQQAAMLGMSRELWSNKWFSERLPQLCADRHPGTVYVPSTPTGGVLPFHANSGICHYYGVGAYLRSTSELRQANVKFTPECLGFANVPEPEMVHVITEGALPITHHPNWKQRIPRDSGAGWDFEDVRDNYLRHVYGLDPIQLRTTDINRYLELSRVVSGEMMAQTFSEWRSSFSQNRGGLVWFFKDLWPAAGWGILDSSGTPKAAYYFLKRVWRSRQMTITDEGLNGLGIHIVNESSDPFECSVEVTLLKEPNVVIGRNDITLQIKPRGQQLISADEILGSFHDVNYAYRFGPPQHDVVFATLFGKDRQVISEASYFVRRRESIIAPVLIETHCEKLNETEYRVTLHSENFLHNVRLSAKNYRPEDNYFHLMPHREKAVRFMAVTAPGENFQAELEALNLENPISISVAAVRG